jgi:hypothetical protein
MWEKSGRSLFSMYDPDIRLEELRKTIIRMVDISAAVRKIHLPNTNLSRRLIRTEHLNLWSHKRSYNTEKWSEYLVFAATRGCLRGYTACFHSTRCDGSIKTRSWNSCNLKQLSMILNTVGAENHLLLLDIVKRSVWSGVRYKLPAETNSNNDVAHSELDHVTLSVSKPVHPTPSLSRRINAHGYSQLYRRSSS